MGTVIVIFAIIIGFIVIMTIRASSQSQERNEVATVAYNAFDDWKRTNGIEKIQPKSYTVPGYGIYMFVDESNKKLLFWQNKWNTTKLEDRFTTLNSKHFEIDFAMLTNCEICIDNNNNTTKLADAVVGGIVLGAVGAASALLSEKINSISVNLFTTSISNPIYEIKIIDKPLKVGLNVKNQTELKEKTQEAIDFAKTIYGTVCAINSQSN